MITVEPVLPVADLEEVLSRAGISGVPVVVGGTLAGVVSRSDIVRALTQATGSAVATLAYYRDIAGAAPDSGTLARMAGERAASMRVSEIMTADVIAVPADRSVQEIARDLVSRGMHRVLVVEGKRSLGLVTTLDLVRAIAEGRLVAPPGG